MRLFLGLPLPENLKSQVEEAWRPFSDKLKHRPIDPALWHLTMAFLDEVPEGKIPVVKDLVNSALAKIPSGKWRFTRFETFPHTRRPANIVAHADLENFKAWSKFVDDLRDILSVEAPGIDRKPWHPHVTLGKALKNQKLELWQQEITPIVWDPESLALVKSVLTDKGPNYEYLHEFKLRI